MPLYDFACPSGHTREVFLHRADQAATAVIVCACDAPMAKAFSMGRGLTYFEEGRGQWIENLGPTPVYITSHEAHKKAMSAAGVDWATAGTGRKGCWQ
jgi:hypothetical protein